MEFSRQEYWSALPFHSLSLFFFFLWAHIKNEGKMYLHHMWDKERSIFVVELPLPQEPKGLTLGRHLCHPCEVHQRPGHRGWRLWGHLQLVQSQPWETAAGFTNGLGWKGGQGARKLWTGEACPKLNRWKFVYLLMAMLYGMQDLSSPTRGQSQAPCSGSPSSWPLDHQGSTQMRI